MINYSQAGFILLYRFKFNNYFPIKTLLVSFFILCSLNSYASENDCIHQAAACFNINPLIIKAIIWKESNNKQSAINLNKNKTHDVGVMQINSIHFSSLSKFGINEFELKNNTCTNVFSGSWILANIINDYGYTWEGIGRYHSKTPSLRDNYSYSIINIIKQQLEFIDTIKIPYIDGIREKFSC